MKVAIFYNLDFGGAKRTVQEHVRGLKKLGHQVDVYTTDSQKDDLSPAKFADHEYFYQFEIRNVSVPVIKRIYSDLQVFFGLKKLHKAIASDIDKRGYDVALIHADMYTQSPFILRFLKTKNIYHSMEPLRIAYEYSLRVSDDIGLFNKIYETINRYIRKNIDRTNARAATEIMAISYYGRAYLMQVYDIVPHVSYLGVDPEVFVPKKIKKKLQIFYCAPKESIFGFDLLEQALKLIPKEIRPEIRIVFGPKKSIRLSEKDVVKVYNESIVTVSLSKLDTFGIVPLESMACEVPVIATNTPAYREIVVDGKTGFLIEFNPQELAEKIVYLIKNPTMAIKMGSQGRILVKKQWTWEIQVKKLEKLLSSLVDQE